MWLAHSKLASQPLTSVDCKIRNFHHSTWQPLVVSRAREKFATRFARKIERHCPIYDLSVVTCTLYIHACMHARSVARERDNAARSWVDALCSFPCVHYIFRPLRLQGYARNGRLFSLIAIFPRQSPANRIRIPLLRNVRLASYRPISLSRSLSLSPFFALSFARDRFARLNDSVLRWQYRSFSGSSHSTFVEFFSDIEKLIDWFLGGIFFCFFLLLQNRVRCSCLTCGLFVWASVWSKLLSLLLLKLEFTLVTAYHEEEGSFLKLLFDFLNYNFYTNIFYISNEKPIIDGKILDRWNERRDRNEAIQN